MNELTGTIHIQPITVVVMAAVVTVTGWSGDVSTTPGSSPVILATVLHTTTSVAPAVVVGS